MKIILQKNQYYYAIDLETSRWSDTKYSIDEALICIQYYVFTNTTLTQCTSEEEIFKELQEYPEYKLVEFIDDKNNLYEYW